MLGDACGGGDGGEVLEGAGGCVWGWHVEVVFLEDLDGEGGEGDFDRVVCFALGELEVVLAVGQGDESVAAGFPVDPAHGGLGAEDEPVAGEDDAFAGGAAWVAGGEVVGGECRDAGDFVGGDGDGEFGSWDLGAYLAPCAGGRPAFAGGVGKEVAQFFEMALGGCGGVLVFAEVGLAEAPCAVFGGEGFVDAVECEGVAGFLTEFFEVFEDEAVSGSGGGVDAFIGHVADELFVSLEESGGGCGGFVGAEHGGDEVVVGDELAGFNVCCVCGDGAGGDGVEGGVDGGGVGVGVFDFAVGPEAGVGFDGCGELYAADFVAETPGC